VAEQFKLPPVWLTRSAAAEYLGVSLATLDRMRVPWCEEAIRGKIRYKIIGSGKRPMPRLFQADVEACVTAPSERRAA
jgi:hypothetical protein